MFSAYEIVDDDVPAAFGRFFQYVGIGLFVIAFALFTEVIVGEPYSASVLPFSSGDISGEGDRVEQSAYDENSATCVFRKVFIEHQQIVAKIEVGLARFAGRKRGASEMVHVALRYGVYFVSQ